jgi:hypothetical protein
VQGELFGADPELPVGVVLDQMVAAAEGSGVFFGGSSAMFGVLVVEGFAVVDVAAPDGLSAGRELASAQ